ncbi:unnamed protein product, partial [Iphiclides podalirius]
MIICKPPRIADALQSSLLHEWVLALLAVAVRRCHPTRPHVRHPGRRINSVYALCHEAARPHRDILPQNIRSRTSSHNALMHFNRPVLIPVLLLFSGAEQSCK